MILSEPSDMEILVIYWSGTGNTRKVAYAIKEGFERAGAAVSLRTVEDAKNIDFLDFDLVCFGFPSHQWHPPKIVDSLLKGKHAEYRKRNKVRLAAPPIAGKRALIFCTYSGPHTGINEAIPAGKYVGQFFEHLGFRILDEWYVVGEFHGSDELSTQGRLGDIRGRPNETDLNKVMEDAERLFKNI
jgi:flavorubredoxin